MGKHHIMLVFLLLSALDCAFVAGGDQPDFSRSSKVKIFNKAGVAVSEETKLREVPFPKFSTTMMYIDDRVALDPALGAVVLYAGSGAKTEFYGIGPSMGPIANALSKLRVRSFAFENPMNMDVEKYASLQAQVDWMASTLEYVASQTSGPIRIATRSTSTNVALQGISEYLSGSADRQVFGKASRLFGMGLLGTDPDEVDRWFEKERTHLRNEGLADEPVLAKDPEIFKAATWETKGARPIVNGGEQIPQVTFTAGGNDEISSLQTQFDVAERFSRNHPEVPVTVLMMDTKHNPGASVNYTDIAGKIVRAGTMERLSPILRTFVAGEVNKAPGLRTEIHRTVPMLANGCQQFFERIAPTVSPENLRIFFK